MLGGTVPWDPQMPDRLTVLLAISASSAALDLSHAATGHTVMRQTSQPSQNAGIVIQDISATRLQPLVCLDRVLRVSGEIVKMRN